MFEKIVYDNNSGQMLRLMHVTGELKDLLPEVDQLYGVPQRADYHPEVCTGWHIELCLAHADRQQFEAPVKIAILLHDVGKGITEEAVLPQHMGHEKAGVPLVERIFERYPVPEYIRALTLFVTEHHLRVHNVLSASDKGVLRLIDAMTDAGGRSKHEMFLDVLRACEADAAGRLGFERKPYPQRQFLLGVYGELVERQLHEGMAVDHPDFPDRHRQRLDIVKKWQKHFKETI